MIIEGEEKLSSIANPSEREGTGKARAKGLEASHIHLRHLSPFPRNLGGLLARFERVLVPELNTGQLLAMLRSTYLVPAEGLNRIAGRPFRIGDVEAAIGRMLED